MLLKFTISILLIALFESTASAKSKSRVLLFQKVDHEYNHKYISKSSINITADHSTINSDMVIAQNITDTIWLKLLVKMKLAKMTEYRTILSYDADGCDLLGKAVSQKLNILYTWTNSFFKYTDLPRSCPILTGKYVWHNFKLDKNGVPPFAMDGLYQSNTVLYFKRGTLREMLSNTTLYTILKLK